ncbi:hypothetical protein AZZ78_000621, partial [Klebsiella pneumoniae]
EPVRGSCRPGKAQPPPGSTTGTVSDAIARRRYACAGLRGVSL